MPDAPQVEFRGIAETLERCKVLGISATRYLFTHSEVTSLIAAVRADERAALASQAAAEDREVVERILETCDDIADTMLRCTAKIHPDQTKPTDWEPYPTHVRLMGGSWTPVKHADLLRARDAEIETILSRLAALRAERDALQAKGESLCGAHGNALIEIHDLKIARDALAQRVGELEGAALEAIRDTWREYFDGDLRGRADFVALYRQKYAALAGRKGEG